MQSTENNRPDLYAILGVNENATQDEITRAYRKKAREHHPDKWPEAEKAEHTAKFQEVNTANEILSDPQKRADYDQSRSATGTTLGWAELGRLALEFGQIWLDLAQDLLPHSLRLKTPQFHQSNDDVYLLKNGEEAIFNGGDNITFENARERRACIGSLKIEKSHTIKEST